jgi:hypothetical protein
VQVVNNTVRIYSNTLATIATDSTSRLAGISSVFASDPEVIYDPGAKKFFYALMEQNAAGSWSLDYGFSKTSAPNSPSADFCHYRHVTGTVQPDYPRLGASNSFVLIGTNNFGAGETYRDSSVYWAVKPSSASVTTCPASPLAGTKSGLPWTPVPSHQTDPNGTGYVVASEGFGGESLTHYAVTKSATTGGAVFSSARSVPVPGYSVPADAPQKGTTDRLGTLDNRLYQVVQSVDPRLGQNVLWTAHTVFAGAGAGVRWYELAASTGAVLQTGLISNSTVSIFNGTISSDRAYVSSTSQAFGSTMVVGYSTSSPTTYPSLAVASKRGADALSLRVTVTASKGPLTCGNDEFICRWGDRSSAHAAPDGALTSATGRVWVTNGSVSGGEYAATNVQIAP